MLKKLKEYTQTDGKVTAAAISLDGLDMIVCNTGRISFCSNWSALWDSSVVTRKHYGSESFGHINFIIRNDIKNQLFGGNNEKL